MHIFLTFCYYCIFFIVYFINCYKVAECIGASRVREATTGHLDTITKSDLDIEFYRNLGFDESIWDFDTISVKGYPELNKFVWY